MLLDSLEIPAHPVPKDKEERQDIPAQQDHLDRPVTPDSPERLDSLDRTERGADPYQDHRDDQEHLDRREHRADPEARDTVFLVRLVQLVQLVTRVSVEVTELLATLDKPVCLARTLATAPVHLDRPPRA